MAVTIQINPANPAHYDLFLQCKKLPRYEVKGRTFYTDEESYAAIFGGHEGNALKSDCPLMYDYQRWVTDTALRMKRYAAFLDCGLGKTLIILEWARQINNNMGKVLLLCPLSVMQEFINDRRKFSMDVNITNLRETGGQWKDGIGIMNYESLRDIDMRGVKGIAVDESSILKNGDGKTRNWLVSLSKNIPYRLACSATPAPNEQAEYASHAVFLGISQTSKEFYSRFFRKDKNDWLLKEHARKPFYKFLQTWACYIQNPMEMGFQQGGYLLEDPDMEEIEVSDGGYFTWGKLFPDQIGIKEMRAIERYRFIPDTERFNVCIENANKYHSIVWASRNEEEKALHQRIEGSELITGATAIERRVEIIEAFRQREINCIVSKPQILGFGVNLQQAEAHIYSGYDFSFERMYQAIRRSHRNGRDGRLKVVRPAIPAEMPIIDSLNAKQKTFNDDVIELQKLFTS